MWLLVATMNFSTKVTDSSYQRVRTAVLKAFQRAVVLREKGLDVAQHLLDTPESWEAVATSEIPLLAVPEDDAALAEAEPGFAEVEPTAAEDQPSES
jgi:hypothetical protein